jgi:phenylalanyl-tRNA synthetase alpha chain
MREDINNIKNEALSRIMDASNPEELENIRIEYLGRQGKITKLIREIGKLDADEKRMVGSLVNDSKGAVTEAIENQNTTLNSDSTKTQWFDPTVPGIKPQLGNLHLVTKAIEEISAVFEKIGFIRMRYPEVEWDWQAFGSLNFDKWHPARDDWETFFIDAKSHPEYGPMVLTPHTSSGQVREMERAVEPPIRMINIAKCYRRQTDASHVPMFHQFEGLVVDKEISIVHLRGTLDYFARTFFGPERTTRIRPYNFPFTEPSFEVDINCGVCRGTSKQDNGDPCKVCKEGWLEIGGCGMVHPNVLKAGGIDPNIYTGFAFGWGVERVYMMKEGLKIPDIRLLYSNDLRVLKQF